MAFLKIGTWVEWKTLKASPARKSRDERSPATGRRENPVTATANKNALGTWDQYNETICAMLELP